MMNKEEIYSIWAPDESLWSRWAKPVLFAHLDSSQIDGTEAPGKVDWCPPPAENVALVLDLPGAEGVLAGVALARCGYRPVPLYNAVPVPSWQPVVDPLTDKPLAAVNVLPILRGLKAGRRTRALEAAIGCATGIPARRQQAG